MVKACSGTRYVSFEHCVNLGAPFRRVAQSPHVSNQIKSAYMHVNYMHDMHVIALPPTSVHVKNTNPFALKEKKKTPCGTSQKGYPY